MCELNPDIFCKHHKKSGENGENGETRVNTGVCVSPLQKQLGENGGENSENLPTLPTSENSPGRHKIRVNTGVPRSPHSPREKTSEVNQRAGLNPQGEVHTMFRTGG